jgi:hypothetical protein
MWIPTRAIPCALLVTMLPSSTAAQPQPAAKFQGFQLERPWKADRRFHRADDDSGFLLTGGMAFRRHHFERALFEVTDGNLVAIHLRSGTRKPTELAAFDRFLDETCKAMGKTVDERTPSPIGTPSPGEKWDPVIVTHRQCTGAFAGLEVTAHEELVRASNFRRAELEVTIAAPPP